MNDKQHRLTHFSETGAAHMVDVGDKAASERIAIAEGYIVLAPETMRVITSGGHHKGDVLGVARIGAIMAAKRTADLIPLCHPIVLSHVSVEFETDSARSRVTCQVIAKTIGPTGVEIEALNAVQVALLTVYDMCKSIDRGMTIEGVRLVEKRGGRSGHWQRKT